MVSTVQREFSRKAFLGGSGALIVGFSLAGNASADTINISPAGPTGLDSWITIHADNTVTVLAGKVEYGQGTTTGLRQIAAEELGISLDQIRWVRPQTGVTPNLYLNTLLMERAIDVLVKTGKPVADIGFDLGFSSQSVFTRFFASNVGMAPTDYRRAAHVL